MRDLKMTLEVSAQDIASCNICYARNYDSPHTDAIGERVDRLYSLKIGDQVMTLCDKCLDRLREKLAQRLSTERASEIADGQIVLFTGTEFTAMDKQGKTYHYRMIGAEVSRDGLTRLLNLDTNRLTYVEPEWFRQRKIKIIQKGERDAAKKEYIDRKKLLERIDDIWDCNDMVFEGDRDHSCGPDDCKGCHWFDTKQYIRKIIENMPAVALQKGLA